MFVVWGDLDSEEEIQPVSEEVNFVLMVSSYSELGI